MDVDKRLFYARLLPILRHIANAEFVAFDLEMSGIGSSIKREDKPNLQEVYEDVKFAAETYQVLQVGLTCIEKDEDLDLYIARPYNFNLSPLFVDRDRLGIERTFAFSSSAVQFLLNDRVNFDIAAPFYTGIPYLSRDEEEEARAKFESSVVYTNLVISPNDIAALTFYRTSRKTIKNWIAEPASESKNTVVNITVTGGRYGIRLIHQLVRTEFPRLVVRYVREGDYMQVSVRDEEKEAAFFKTKLRTFEKNIAKQIGLRFIFEALFGGDLSKIDPTWFNVDDDGNAMWRQPEDTLDQLKSITETLKVRRPALIGHNMNTDLAFMYKTFIGELPDTFQEFASKVHELCPIIIDTKYLATHNCGTMDTQSALHGLLDQFDKQAYPCVVLAEAHASYANSKKTHEAGYDSWITAKVLLKFAAKLFAEYSPSQLPLGRPIIRSTRENTPYQHRPTGSESSVSSSRSSNGGVSLLDTDIADFNKLINGKTYDDMHKEAYYASVQAVAPAQPAKKLRGRGEAAEKGMSWHSIQLNGGYPKREPKPGVPDQWLPGWDHPFWREYVNRLRVFQAREGFYVLEDYAGAEK